MKNLKKAPNNNTNPLRIIAGFYLLYLVYSLVKDWQRLDNKVLFGIFIAIFTVFGIVLIITSALSLLRNKNAQLISEEGQDEEKAEEGQDEEMAEEKSGTVDTELADVETRSEDKDLKNKQ